MESDNTLPQRDVLLWEGMLSTQREIKDPTRRELEEEDKEE